MKIKYNNGALAGLFVALLISYEYIGLFMTIMTQVSMLIVLVQGVLLKHLFDDGERG